MVYLLQAFQLIWSAKQTEIGITPWVISYNEVVIENPYQFKPERWLNATKEQRMLMGTSSALSAAAQHIFILTTKTQNEWISCSAQAQLHVPGKVRSST